jgi:prolyl 4-hydroxylase
MPAVDTKWVSQVWIRQSFRADGQPSQPVSQHHSGVLPRHVARLCIWARIPPLQVPLIEQTLVGPLHEGVYRGHCLAGDDIHEAVMTLQQAQQWASSNPLCFGFTFQHASREPTVPVRCWFKSKLKVLYSEDWWTYSLGRGMD